MLDVRLHLVVPAGCQVNYTLTDRLFGVPRVVADILNNHPAANIVVASSTKARRSPTRLAVERGPGWAVSRRGVLVLTDESLICGDWTIHLGDIESAVLHRLSSILSEVYVLDVVTRGGDSFQFGLRVNEAWERQTTLPMTVERGRLGYSWVSVLIRAALVAWGVWLLVRWLR